MALDKPRLERTVATIGDSLIATYHCKTLESGEILYYSACDGVYKRGGDKIIEQTVRQQVDREISKHNMAEILYYIQTSTYTNLAEFDRDPLLLHLENGWLHPDTGELKDHSPEMLSLFKIPHTYVSAAANPAQLEFFAEIFEAEDLDALQKFFGYLLLPDNRYKKAFIGVGPKDTGKSKFSELVEKFCGSPSHVSLHDMAAYNHNVASITKSIVNTTSELPKYKLKDVSLFKGITGGDELSFREIYGKPFNARVRAKFLMVSNELPDFDGMDQTFIDRWIVFRFSNVFKQGEDMDVNILEKLTTPQEMSGLLNYALEGRKKLLAEGFFKNEDYADLRSKWDSITSKIGGFVEKECIMKKNAIIPADELFNDYKNSGGELSRVIFGREIKKLGVVHKRQRVLGKLVWVYEGITTKSAAEVVPCVLGNLLIPSTMENNIEGGVQEFHGTPGTASEEVSV